MAKKRYLVEFGTGADLHGMDVTKAAKKALRDAISHCSMAGLSEIVGIDPISADGTVQVSVDVVIAAPFKDQVDVKEALTALPPYKEVNAVVVDGGLAIDSGSGKGRAIVLVNAALTVWVDM